MRQDEDFDASLAGEEEEADDSKASWFKRIKKGILTSTKDKENAPEGLWTKCPNCKYTCTISELAENKFVCPKCEHHHRIGSEEYFDIIFDKNSTLNFLPISNQRITWDLLTSSLIRKGLRKLMQKQISMIRSLWHMAKYMATTW